MGDLVKVSYTGTGEIGEITAAGISGSDITPHSPLSGNAQIATVSVTGKTTDSAEYMSENQLTLELPNIGPAQTTLDSVNIAGNTTTVSGPGNLSRFLTGNVSIPAVASGNAVGALDVALQVSGVPLWEGRNVYPQGVSENVRYWSMNGHGAGFDYRGELVQVEAPEVPYSPWNYEGTDLIAPSDVAILGPAYNTPWVSPTSGQMYTTQHPMLSRVGLTRGPSAGERVVISFFMPKDPPYNSPVNIYQSLQDWRGPGNEWMTLSLNPATNTASLVGVGFVLYDFNITLDTSGVTADEWFVAISFTSNSATLTVSNPDGSGRVSGTGSGPNVNISTGTFSYGERGPWGGLYYAGFPASRGFIIDRIPAAWTNYDTPRVAPQTYFEVQGVPNTVADAPIASADTSAWDYLNQVAAGLDVEFASVGGKVVLRPQRVTPIEITEYVGMPSVAPVANFAEAVSLEWAESPPRADPWWLYEDVEEILTVGAGEVVTVSVPTNSWFYFIRQPLPSHTSTLAGNSIRGYAVTGQDNLPVVPNQWLDYGGSVYVHPSRVAGELEVTLTGPREEIPGVPGPYRFAASDGENDYPLLRFSGLGVQFGPTQTTTSLTGAPKRANTQIEPVTFTNVCATSWGRAWGLIADAAGDHGVPVTDLTGLTIPTTKALQLGLNEGSVFRWRNSLYRVMSVNYNIGTTSLTARAYTSYSDVFAKWPGATYQTVQSFWSGGYTYIDVSLTPLRTEW